MTIGKETASAKRFWYMDILRVLATFTVIALHVNPRGYLEVSVDSAEWLVMTILTALCSWNVPVFFMISGAIFLSPQRKLSTKQLYGKTILRMLMSFGVWSAFYAVVECVLKGKGKWMFLNQFFRGHYHLWYIFAIISLYWITPLLRRITESRKSTEYLLVTGFAATCLLGRTIGFFQLFDLPHSDVLQSIQTAYAQINPYRGLIALFYFVLGHYLHTYPLGQRARRALYALGLSGLAAAAGLSVWISNMKGETNAHFFSHDSLWMILMAAAIFVGVQSAAKNFGANNRMARILKHLSKCSFGVYLIHAFVIERWNPTFHTSAGILCLEILGISCRVYLVCVLASSVLNKIPVINKYIV